MINGRGILKEPLSKIVDAIFVYPHQIGARYVLERGLQELKREFDAVEFNEHTFNWFLNFEELLFKYEQLLDEMEFVGLHSRERVPFCDKKSILLYRIEFAKLKKKSDSVLDLKYKREKKLEEEGPRCPRKGYDKIPYGLRLINDPCIRVGSERGLWII